MNDNKINIKNDIKEETVNNRFKLINITNPIFRFYLNKFAR